MKAEESAGIDWFVVSKEKDAEIARLREEVDGWKRRHNACERTLNTEHEARQKAQRERDALARHGSHELKGQLLAQAKAREKAERERDEARKTVDEINELDSHGIGIGQVIRNAEARERKLREALRKARPWVCSHCGPHIKVDEDGCCVGCGRDAALADDAGGEG